MFRHTRVNRVIKKSCNEKLSENKSRRMESDF